MGNRRARRGADYKALWFGAGTPARFAAAARRLSGAPAKVCRKIFGIFRKIMVWIWRTWKSGITFRRGCAGERPSYPAGFRDVSATPPRVFSCRFGALLSMAKEAFAPFPEGSKRVARFRPATAGHPAFFAAFLLGPRLRYSSRRILRRQAASIGAMQNMMKWENLPNRRVKILSD